MSEAGDYTPAPHWGGHDFKSARRVYDDHRKRSYADAITAGVSASDLVPKELKTNCESPLIIACDVTGSMGEWPGVIFSKLPYLEYEGQEYLGDGMEISFAAIGDANSDKYANQIRPFAKGADLKASLEKLIIEGGGGGSSQESYDLTALYYARHCECPEAIRKPIMIFIGDEGLYPDVYPTLAEQWCRVETKKNIPLKQVFEELTEKFCVYVIRKPYNCSLNSRSEADLRIEKQWMGLLGEDHVVNLPGADRVVDVIFGILAKETGRIDYFEKELKDRQGKDADGDAKIGVVMKSLMTVHAVSKASLKKLEGPKGAKSKSVMPSKKAGSKKASKSVSLLDDE